MRIIDWWNYYSSIEELEKKEPDNEFIISITIEEKTYFIAGYE